MQLEVQDIRNIERATTIYASLCVIILMICTSFTVENLIERFTPDGNSGVLPWLAAFAATEALVSQRYFVRSGRLNTHASIYRVTELILIFLATRLATLPWNASVKISQIFIDWKADPLENFFDAQLLISLMAIMIIWGVSLMFAQDLAVQEGDELALDDANLKSLVSDRAAVQQRLAGRVFTVGGLLVLINTFLRQERIQLFGVPSSEKSGVWHVVVYFIVGLVLLSLSQLSNRRLSWAWEKIPVRTNITNKWISTSVIFLALIVIVAFIMPKAYSDDFLPVIGDFIGLILSFLFSIFLLIISPIIYFFGWLMRLFLSNGVNEQISPQPPAFLPTQIPDPLVIPKWLEQLKPIFLWVMIFGVIGYALYIYFNQNKTIASGVQRIRGLDWLIKTWLCVRRLINSGLRRLLQKIIDGISKRRTKSWQRKQPFSGSYLNLRRLNTRQKVFFYYLALLRRTGEAKLPRADWQTPHEYDTYLRQQLPEIDQELKTMVDLFIEARYSQHTVNESQIFTIRMAWKQVCKLLRLRRKRQSREREA